MEWNDNATAASATIVGTRPMKKTSLDISSVSDYALPVPSAVQQSVSTAALTSLRQGYGGPPKRFARRRKAALHIETR